MTTTTHSNPSDLSRTMTIRMLGSFLLLLLFVSLQDSNALLLPTRCNAAFVSGTERRRGLPPLAAARYGPPPPDFFPTNNNDDDSNTINDQKDQSVSSSSSLFVVDEEMEKKFLNLLQQVMTASKPEHIPGLLTRHLDFLFALTQPVLDSVIRKAQKESDDEQQLQKQMLNAIELVVTFLHDFVEQAQHMDLRHKELLGEIITTMRKKDEVELDRFLESKQKQLTPGFLRHIEGECERVANAPKMTKDSSRLLQLLYTIQARVLEELGKVKKEKLKLLSTLWHVRHPSFGTHALCAAAKYIYIYIGYRRGCLGVGTIVGIRRH